MGMRLFSGGGDEYEVIKPKPPNPDPASFRIIRAKKIGHFLVAEIVYPDCTTFEGRKIIVYKGISERQLREKSRIDPHFYENKKDSPIARFVPTKQGWQYAESFCLANTKGARS